MKLNLTIEVERVEFDAEQCSLRINGKNIEENEHVKLGQFHTVELELHKSFKLDKSCWDQIYLDLLNISSDIAQRSDIAAIVLQEGLCHICLVSSSMTVTKSRIERNIPKKKQGTEAVGKARNKFFQEIYEAIKSHINFDIVKVVLVGRYVNFYLHADTRCVRYILIVIIPQIINDTRIYFYYCCCWRHRLILLLPRMIQIIILPFFPLCFIS